jgi:hypothetical protein
MELFSSSGDQFRIFEARRSRQGLEYVWIPRQQLVKPSVANLGGPIRIDNKTSAHGDQVEVSAINHFEESVYPGNGARLSHQGDDVFTRHRCRSHRDCGFTGHLPCPAGQVEIRAEVGLPEAPLRATEDSDLPRRSAGTGSPTDLKMENSRSGPRDLG